MRRKTTIYASALLVFSVVLIVGYFAFWRDASVTVYDDSLRVDFYLSSEYDEPIATLRVGELKKHKK